MSAFYGPTKTEEENFKVLTRAADIGVTFWDTADVYGNGHNEGIHPSSLRKSYPPPDPSLRGLHTIMSAAKLLEGGRG